MRNRLTTVRSLLLLIVACQAIGWACTTDSHNGPNASAFFSEDFDDVSSVAELITEGRWSGYDELAGGTLSIDQGRLKCVVPAKTTVTPKAQLQLTGLSFPEKSELWVEWYMLVEGQCDVLTLFDLEDSSLPSSPGRTCYLTTSERFRSIMNKDGNPIDQIDQRIDPTPVPSRWVQVRLYLHMSKEGPSGPVKNIGRVRIWIDGNLVLDGIGRTMPAASTALDRVNFGITATQNPLNGNTLYLDKVKLWTSPPSWWQTPGVWTSLFSVHSQSI